MTLVGCGSTQAAPAGSDRTPQIAVEPTANLCVTKGAIASASIAEPTVRAFALGAGGDAAQLTFTFGGDSQTTRELASGAARRQLGLKLRAQDGCNVVYVMWRLDPKPKLDVSLKHNPGKRTHEECGAEGYTKVRPSHATPVPDLQPGHTHTLRAEIIDDDLYAWIDGKLAWQGRLPDEARTISGPAGLRTDNLRLDRIELAAPPANTIAPTCKATPKDID